MLRSLLAEFIGTFFFVTVILVLTSQFVGNIAVALLIGLGLAVAIYFVGAASKGSLNPAVTLALYSRGDLAGSTAVLYIIAELFGAMLAFVWWSYIFGKKKAVQLEWTDFHTV